MVAHIIGIDCATKAQNIGLALGRIDNGVITINEAGKFQEHELIIEMLSDWLGKDKPVLLAVDAPLGWPTELSIKLIDHIAGQVIDTDSNLLFRRVTDKRIKSLIGKQPLDVGADRIARTAHAALKLLDGLRHQTGYPIPMAWDYQLSNPVSAIEVYPAATLKSYRLRSSGYKKKEKKLERREIIDELSNLMSIKIDATIMENDDDILDAVVCVLAGANFISGEAVQPDDQEIPEKEGWIWVRNPGLSS